MPRVQRCPKHSRRKPRKTGKCISYDPPYQKKFERCKNGHRKNELGDCIPFKESDHKKKWTRCKKGTRRDGTGRPPQEGCTIYKNKDISYNSRTVSELDDKRKDELILKLNEERIKLKKMIQKKSKSKTKSKSKSKSESGDSIESFLRGIKTDSSKKKTKRIETLSSSKKSSQKSKSKSKSSIKMIEDRKKSSSLNSKQKKLAKKVIKKMKTYKKPIKKKSKSEPKPESVKKSRSKSSSSSDDSEEYEIHRKRFFSKYKMMNPGLSDRAINSLIKKEYYN